MKFRCLKTLPAVVAAALVTITSGCATAFVRSKSTVASQHIFPATVFDAQFFWDAGVQGKPLLATADRGARNSPLARCACTIGAIMDMPFSRAFDTVLLPVDLSRATTPEEKRDADGEESAAAIRR